MVRVSPPTSHSSRGLLPPYSYCLRLLAAPGRLNLPSRGGLPSPRRHLLPPLLGVRAALITLAAPPQVAPSLTQTVPRTCPSPTPRAVVDQARRRRASRRAVMTPSSSSAAPFVGAGSISLMSASSPCRRLCFWPQSFSSHRHGRGSIRITGVGWIMDEFLRGSGLQQSSGLSFSTYHFYLIHYE
jgi:hypothetical protein